MEKFALFRLLDALAGLAPPAADPPQQLERQLAAVYGSISLHRCADRSGRQQLVLLKEPEGCGTIDP